MKVQVLKHVPFEGIGNMEPWLLKNGADIQYTCFYEKPELPDIQGLDLIIVMGGPMSVNDEKIYSWLRPEKEFIRKALELKVPLLGVCLGAQLMASALGCKVYPSPLKEIGWFPIQAVQIGSASIFQFPDELNVFHWHGETFDMPQGATRLARTNVCKNQAFQLGKKALGLQFHLETTTESARALLENSGHEMVPGPYIQSRSNLLETPKEFYLEINKQMDRVLAFLTA